MRTEATSSLTMAVAIIAGLLFTAGDARAAWIGDTVDVTRSFPATPPAVGDVSQDLGTGVVPGATFVDTIYGIGTVVTITVDAKEVDFSFADLVALGFGAGPFNGFIVTDLTGDPDITNVTIASQTDFNLIQDDISFTSDSIAVNMAFLSIETDSAVALDVQFGDVPEPASLTLFGGGLIGLAIRRSRRKRKA